MNILVTTGIYPPKIGGPAQYAKNLGDAFKELSHQVTVKTYGIEDRLPTGIRHFFFFFKIIPSVLCSNVVFILDTFSVGLPTIFACKIFRKKGIIRTGGDFLWEQYTERTGKKVLLKNFYITESSHLNFKERVIFRLTKWVLNNASHVIFSTNWQRSIFISAYGIDQGRTSIIENYYGPKEADIPYHAKEFVGSARNLAWKNLNLLKKIFWEVGRQHSDASLFLDNLPFNAFMEKIANAYCVILISLGDISPNMILDAIKYNRPFICTKEVGIYDRIKDAGIFVDPLNEVEIKRAVLDILDPRKYADAKAKVRDFNFTHTWEEIAAEFINILKSE